MRFALLPIFIISSLTELTILITMGRYIGIWWTILIVAGTAFIGTMVLRQQGLRTLAHINKSMARGVPPVEPLVEGFLIVIAGALLLTPGIITDVIGFSLLVPQLRQRVAIWGLERFLIKATVHVRTPKENRETSDRQHQSPQPPRQDGRGPVIDGEFECIDEKTRNPSKQQ
ncbi:MAG: FxsA family protein [Pseudomonadota bacterium]